MQNDSNSNKKESLIVFEHVSKTYEGKSIALRDASFSVQSGELVAIVGPSGGGKSTILKLIAGLEEATSGTLKRPQRVSMAFQSGALLPWLSVYDNAAFGMKASGASGAAIARDVQKYLSMMKLEAFADELPSELSGGQKQRVGIARALAVNPEVLLLDEPFSALDAKTTAELHDDLIRVWKETKKTVLIISHLIEEAVSLAERVILVKDFTIMEEFPIPLSYPRREQGASFMQDVERIRRAFFK